MIPGLLVASTSQCKWNRHQGACLEIFQAIGRFEPSFFEAHHSSKMNCNVWSLKSRMKTGSFLEEIITSTKVVFTDFEYDISVRIRRLVDPTRKTGKINNTVKQTASS